MKKLVSLMLIILSVATVSFGQTKSSTPSANFYTSVGLSLTNGDDFKNNNYVSIENGIVTTENVGLGFVFGRKDLNGLASSSDKVGSYFYEVKTFYNLALNSKVTGTLLAGYGGLFDLKTNFIEYGFGASYAIKKFSLGVTYSNWAGTNYVTPSLTYNY